jgi:hypothetical protein
MAILVTRNAKEAKVAPMVGSGGVCVWREFEVLSQAVGFMVVR